MKYLRLLPVILVASMLIACDDKDIPSDGNDKTETQGPGGDAGDPSEALFNELAASPEKELVNSTVEERREYTYGKDDNWYRILFKTEGEEEYYFLFRGVQLQGDNNSLSDGYYPKKGIDIVSCFGENLTEERYALKIKGHHYNAYAEVTDKATSKKKVISLYGTGNGFKPYFRVWENYNFPASTKATAKLRDIGQNSSLDCLEVILNSIDVNQKALSAYWTFYLFVPHKVSHSLDDFAQTYTCDVNPSQYTWLGLSSKYSVDNYLHFYNEKSERDGYDFFTPSSNAGGQAIVVGVSSGGKLSIQGDFPNIVAHGSDSDKKIRVSFSTAFSISNL